MPDNLIKLGVYNPEFNRILGIDMKHMAIYRSAGLPAHLLKRNHFNALKYIDKLPDIISSPDYVGINPKESNSLELVKMYKDNIWFGIKVNKDNEYYYVSTIYDVQESKIARRLHSGRIKKVSFNENKNDTLPY